MSDEPTWRDVIRAMRSTGILLGKTEAISERWRHRPLIDRGVEQGDIAINHLGEYWVSLYGEDGWHVEMKNPKPVDIFNATRLLKIQLDIGFDADAD